MYLIILTLLITFNNAIHSKPHYERYDRQKKITQPEAEQSQKRSINNDSSDDTTPLIEDHTLDTTPHTPLGSICIEITEYCSYFIDHWMNGPRLSKQRESLQVFCNVLKLLTNLADTDCAIIRLDSYITNIVEIIQALEKASETDTTLTQHNLDYPLIFSLRAQSTETNESNYLIHSTLRAPSSAIPLINELFSELKTYTNFKLDSVLEQFKADTKTLLTISQQSEVSEQQKENELSAAEKKSMESLGWLCRHAANTCMDLAQTVHSSALMAHTGALMNQIHQMLATMALTYNHLGTNQVRSQDRHSLATHYAIMIEFFKSSPPHRGTLSLINYVNSLPSFHEREQFITNLFSTQKESELFLSEFFPSFSDALIHNVDQFCNTLTTQVIETFTKRYWRC
jgi:hypothetical protein